MTSTAPDAATATFASLGVPADLAERLSARGITEPFPVQAATLPDALAGRDVCGAAPTGSGKTLAFGLAVATRVGRARARRPRALILVPTRELAAQVERELRPLAKARGRSVASVYGGVGMEPQRQRLESGTDIVVACPGRLADLVRQGFARLDEVEIVVLDEADRMADMGFLPEVRRLLDQVRPDRQTLLFSATLDGDVDVLVRRYQRDPARHVLAAPEDETPVEHLFWRAERSARIGLVAGIVASTAPTIVFCRTKRGADRLARQLESAGVAAAPIHGNRSQSQRERALAAFANGGVHALVATDVAARGIHVDAVGAVVHYDVPADDKDFVHRSGRTARAGASGMVVTLVGGDEVRDVERMQRRLGLPVGISAPDPAVLGDPSTLPAPRPQPQPEARPAAGSGRGRGGAGRRDGAPRRPRAGDGGDRGAARGRRARRPAGTAAPARAAAPRRRG